MRDLVQEQDLILLLGRGSIAREFLTLPVLSGEKISSEHIINQLTLFL